MKGILKWFGTLRTSESIWNEAVEEALAPKPSYIRFYDRDGRVIYDSGCPSGEWEVESVHATNQLRIKTPGGAYAHLDLFHDSDPMERDILAANLQTTLRALVRADAEQE